MSAGKSEVVAWALQLADGSLDLYRCADPPNAADLAIAHEQKQKFVPLVPESLLLDARAERDLAIAMVGQADAFTCELADKLRAAEALAGEYEGDARRYRIWRDRSNPLTDSLRIEADDLYGDELDTAIDAVGGRGE